MVKTFVMPLSGSTRQIFANAIMSCAPRSTSYIDRKQTPELYSGWLNDDVINFCIRVAAETRFQSSMTATSFAYLKIGQREYDQATKHVMQGRHLTLPPLSDVLRGRTAIERILLPINLGDSHWVLVVVDVVHKLILHYDSLNWDGSVLTRNVLEWIKHVCSQQGEKEWQQINVQHESVRGYPPCAKQNNAIDCGVYTVIHALYAMRKVRQTALPVHPDERDLDIIRYWRPFLACTLLQGRMPPLPEALLAES